MTGSDGKTTIPTLKVKDGLERPLPKRFYSAVSVAAHEAAFAVLLDGRPLRTPKKRALAVPSAALAESVAAEWSAQGERIDPATMPMTRLVNSALDTVADHATEVRAAIVMYAGSDLLCYRAEAPEGLVEAQLEVWNGALDWARSALGVDFMVTTGLMPVAQPAAATAAVARAIAGLEPLRLAALHVMTTLTGSALLALACHMGARDAASVWSAAHIDEDWQISRWGDDAEAASRRALRRTEFEAASRLLTLLG